LHLKLIRKGFFEALNQPSAPPSIVMEAGIPARQKFLDKYAVR